MKLNKADIPVSLEKPDMIMRVSPDQGGMTICFNELPKGADVTPLLKGLVNDSCYCPHWGYVLKGEMLVKYDDGKEETLTEGDVFYLPAGHTALVKEDFKFVEFSPTEQYTEVIAHVGRKMAELAG
jgi:hypothetical protein